MLARTKHQCLYIAREATQPECSKTNVVLNKRVLNSRLWLVEQMPAAFRFTAHSQINSPARFEDPALVAFVPTGRSPLSSSNPHLSARVETQKQLRMEIYRRQGSREPEPETMSRARSSTQPHLKKRISQNEPKQACSRHSFGVI